MGLTQGVDYVQGDPFTTASGQTLYTAKLLGDPIETTIRGLDNAGLYTVSGAPRWSYLDKIPDAKNWDNLDYDQKVEVVKQMYKFEGGKGDLSPVESDIVTNAKGLIDGTIAPNQLTYTARAKAIAQAKRLDPKFDAAKSQIAWNSANKFAQNLNGPQVSRFRGLAQSVVNTIDEVRGLSEQMDQSGITPLNAAELKTLINVAGNSPEGQLASQYLAAVNTLKEEFANLANGGYAPTEAAWGLANSQINANYGVDQLKASLDEVQRLINYRVQAIVGQQPLIPGQSSENTSDNDPLGLGL